MFYAKKQENRVSGAIISKFLAVFLAGSFVFVPFAQASTISVGNSSATSNSTATGGTSVVNNFATTTVASNPNPNPVPVSVSLSVNPSVINRGSGATLSWSSSGATSCFASGGWSGSNKPLSGSETVFPQNTTSYAVTCSNSSFSDSKSVTVTVNAPQSQFPVVNLTANPSQVRQGESSTLSWNTSFADTCSALGAWSGTKSTSGSEIVFPGGNSGSVEYVLICFNGFGQSSSRAFVTVLPSLQFSPTVTISANPSVIDRGQSSVISWNSSNATTCFASGGWSGSKPFSGSETVFPNDTASYALTCSNSSGSVTQSASVSVRSSGYYNQYPVVDLSGSPLNLSSPGYVYLTWSSYYADRCTAGDGWYGSKNPYGTENVYVNSNTTFSLTCSNNAGQTTDRVYATVSSYNYPYYPYQPYQQNIPTVSISANPSVIDRGYGATLNWNSYNANSCYASGGGWSGSKSLTGAETVYPNEATTYTLTCHNSGYSNSQSATVTVRSTQAPYYSGLTAACVADPVNARIGQSVTFAAGVSGGSAPYYYAWSRDVSGSGEVMKTSFSTVGTKYARITVRDGRGQSAEALCSTYVSGQYIAPVVSKPKQPTATEYCETTCKPSGYIKSDEIKYISATTSCPVCGSGNIKEAGNGGQNFPEKDLGKETNLSASLFGTGASSFILFMLVWFILLMVITALGLLIYYLFKRVRTPQTVDRFVI